MAINKDTNDVPAGAVDAYALLEALIGRKLDRHSLASAATPSGLQDGYEDLSEVKMSPEGPKPDDPPKNINIGCINPYALVEALIGRKIDKSSISSRRVLSDVLQTDYDELFDLRFDSLLYAGLKLNDDQKEAQKLNEDEVKIIDERDLETPDLSQAKELADLEKLGLKDVLQTRVKLARMENGKLRLVLHARDLGKTVNNREVTLSVNELALPFRKEKGQWTPPNSSWRDMYETFSHCVNRRLMMGLGNFRIGERFSTQMGFQVGLDSREIPSFNKFDDPIQGALGNSWLIAAIFSVFWANPSIINRDTLSSDQPNKQKEMNRKLAIKFHDKGGENNAKTATVEVNYDIPVNNSDNEPVYCRASDGCAIWPSLYEKAFIKWMTDNSSERPDMTRAYCGDPIKAMAQINGKEPQYYFTERHSASELAGLVRFSSVNFKTIQPMCAYTYASGDHYRGSNLVANHAYSVLGWTNHGQNQHIILRNPWGVTESVGLTSYPGLLDRVEPEFWRPASLLDAGGVLAVEARMFKEYFACIGVAK